MVCLTPTTAKRQLVDQQGHRGHHDGDDRGRHVLGLPMKNTGEPRLAATNASCATYENKLPHIVKLKGALHPHRLEGGTTAAHHRHARQLLEQLRARVTKGAQDHHHLCSKDTGLHINAHHAHDSQRQHARRKLRSILKPMAALERPPMLRLTITAQPITTTTATEIAMAEVTPRLGQREHW